MRQLVTLLGGSGGWATPGRHCRTFVHRSSLLTSHICCRSENGRMMSREPTHTQRERERRGESLRGRAS